MILGTVALGLLIIGKWDKPISISGKGRLWILAGAAAEYLCIVELTGCRLIGESFLLAVIGGCLLLACITDSLLCQVYNFTWWFALAAAVIMLWRRREELTETVFQHVGLPGGMLFLIGLQLLLSGRIYGRADGYAFCVCALVETALGMTVVGGLIHMLTAYILLFIMQAFRRNINKRGNLRKPVPFLPYITVSFWITVVTGNLLKVLIAF